MKEIEVLFWWSPNKLIGWASTCIINFFIIFSYIYKLLWKLDTLLSRDLYLWTPLQNPV